MAALTAVSGELIGGCSNTVTTRARVGVIFRMLPCVAACGRLGLDEFKNLNESIPDDFAFELFLDANRVAMTRLGVVQFFNRFFEQLNVVDAAILSPLTTGAMPLAFQIRTPPTRLEDGGLRMAKPGRWSSSHFPSRFGLAPLRLCVKPFRLDFQEDQSQFAPRLQSHARAVRRSALVAGRIAV